MKCLEDYPFRLGSGLPRTIVPDLRKEGKRAMLPRIVPFIMISCHSQGHQSASRHESTCLIGSESDGALKARNAWIPEVSVPRRGVLRTELVY